MTTETRAKKIDLTDDPTYAEAWARQQALQSELAVLEVDIERVRGAIAQEGQDPLEEAADRLLADGSVEVDPDAAHQERLASLSDLQWRRRVLGVAINKQRTVVATAGARASASICEALRPEYEGVIDNLATALLAAADASEREREFRERLIDGGVTFVADLRPMPFGQDLAAVTSPHGMLAAWFKDAVEHDLIDMDHIPEPWRDRWFGTHAAVRN